MSSKTIPGLGIVTGGTTSGSFTVPIDSTTACPVRDCPVKTPDPNCMCGKPFWMYIPPGQHVHPCLVHPEYVLHGMTSFQIYE